MSGDRFDLLFEQIPAMYFVVDPFGRVEAVSDHGAEKLGYRPDELVGGAVVDVFHPEDRDRVERQLSSCRDRLGQMADWELRKIHRNGRTIWVREVARAIEVDGRVVVLVACQDISDSRRTEASRHRFLTENISDVVFTLDLEGRITYANPAIESLTGWTPEQVAGRPVVELLSTESSQMMRESLAAELAIDSAPGVDADRSRVLDIEVVRRDGVRRFVEAKARFWRDDDGEPAGILGVARDLTAWRRSQEALRASEERLQQAQRLEAVGKLAGGVAHDFNNLLTVIIGNIQMLRRYPPTAESLAERLGEVSSAANKAATLTRQLLAFGRRQTLEPQILDLSAVVAKTQRFLTPLLGERIALRLDLPSDLPTVEADRSQIEQILINLALNARDAMPEGGAIEISTRSVTLDESPDRGHVVASGEYIRLRFEDSGIGIEPEDQARIFEPFFTTKELGHGTGLGLSMVYGIVKQSHGYVWVSSLPGEGTRFDIHLPVSGGAPDEMESTGPFRPGEGGSETVLLVEDEPSVRDLACRVLEREGYRVLSASDGHQALEVVQSFGEPIDLLVTDVVMPRMGGGQLAAAFAQLAPGTPVLFMSGHSEGIQAQHLADRNASILRKPFSPQGLMEAVREALDRHE